MPYTSELSLAVDTGGLSQAVSVSSTSAQSAAISAVTVVSGEAYVVATPTVDVFVRQGVSPTAVADGTDQFLMANVAYRLLVTPGNKLAFKTSGSSGTVYLTPKA